MKRLLQLCSLLAATGFCTVHGQTTTFLEAGNLRSLIGPAGHLWWDTVSKEPSCAFPKGSTTHVGYAGNLWVSGFDTQQQLRVAANTYRQFGNDYWQGPVGAGSPSYPESHKLWNMVWKVTRADLDSFFSVAEHTTTNTPRAILRWPGFGNPYAVGTNDIPLTPVVQLQGSRQEFAPFLDADGDGRYNPLKGDYPELHGDEMVWQVYNDAGGDKTQTRTASMTLQISLLAWAYQRGTIADNLQFYEYQIINRGGPLTNAVVSMFADLDLGDAFDDYIGFDSTYRMGFNYNGSATDGAPGQPGCYGAAVPVAGVAVLHAPGDEVAQDYRTPLGSFTYYIEDCNRDELYNPGIGIEFYRYMTGRCRTGLPFRRDFTGMAGWHTSGLGPGPATRYVFDGDPATQGSWSECFSQNIPGERRFMLNSTAFSFPFGTTRKMAVALVVAPDGGACPRTTLGSIRQVADTAIALYKNPPVYQPKYAPRLVAGRLNLYPNPATDWLSMSTGLPPGEEAIQVLDIAGRVTPVLTERTENGWKLHVADLASGVYAVRVSGGSESGATATFVKQ